MKIVILFILFFNFSCFVSAKDKKPPVSSQDLDTSSSDKPSKAPIKYLGDLGHLEEHKKAILKNKPILLVTHMVRSFIGAKNLNKKDVRKVIRFFSKRDFNSVYLNTFNDLKITQHSLLKNTSPNYCAATETGTHQLPIPFNDVTILGGYLGGCHANSIASTVKRYFVGNYFKKTQKPLTIHLPLTCIYQSYADATKFIRNKRLASCYGLGGLELLIKREQGCYYEKDPFPKDFKAKIYYNGKLVSKKTFGTNPHTKKVIILKYWSKIKPYLKYMKDKYLIRKRTAQKNT